MTTISRAESYSWWWDSHISPKNSKWLHENLTDMDMKVKAMIKLIEEDADSFARRAEMYYKKRPELMKLVEQFYRAYRALAERYDHATGALRHAHRTMSEAFPNHIPFALPDESLSNNITETPSPRRAMFDTDDLQKDAFGVLSPSNDMPINRQGVGRVKLHEGSGIKGLVVYEEEELTARVRLPERKARKSLNFGEDEEIGSRAKVYIDSKSHVQPELKQKENVIYGLTHLQEQVSLLSNENQKLKVQIELESKHLDLSTAEVQNLRDEMSKLESEKDGALLQKQLSHERISSLETEISKLKDEIRKLNEEMEMAVLKLSGAEQQCLTLEKANHSLQLELEEAKIQLEELRHSLNESDHKRVEAEMYLQSKEQLYNQSNEKVMLMTSEIQSLVEKLKEVGRGKVGLEEEVSQLKDINYTLNEHNLACALKMKHLEDEIVFLKEINGKLEDELEIQVESKKSLQQEHESLKDNKNEMELNNQILKKEMEAASLRIESLKTQVKDLQYGNAELKECCSRLEDEKLLFLNKLKDMKSVSERNSVLENTLSDANVELEELRENIEILEGSCESLNAAVSTHVGEKTALAFQIETLAGNVVKLSVENMLLDNSLDDANTELEGLSSKLRNLEESYQSLSHANSDLISQKNNLISQVESTQQSLTNLETTHAALDDKHLNLVKEKDLSANKILNLEDSLNVMQKEHELLIHSKNIRLATLENQLLLLQEDRQLREQAEEQRSFSHMTHIFALERGLHDMSNFLRDEKKKCKSLINLSEIKLAGLESQIHLLQEERKVRDNKIEEEEHKYMNSMLEVSILQKCLSEMKTENLTLLQECQKHLESSRCADERIKQLEDRELVQKENISLLREHISKVRDGIQLLLKPLNINKELMNIEESEVVILPTIFGEINNLLASISDIRDENRILCMEILVYLSLLKQAGLEKVLLSRELEKRNKQSLVLEREHRQLIEEYEQLCNVVSVTDFTNITLKAELMSFTRKLIDSAEKLHNLIEVKNSLEEQNSLMCMDAMTLENLYLFFKSLNAERMQQLKLVSGDMCSILTIKNALEEEIRGSKARVRAVENENMQLKESLVLLEEWRSRITISEYDLQTARSFCEELIPLVEDRENLLEEKIVELSKVNDMLQSKQGEVTEVCRKLEVSNKEVDEAKIKKSELEKKITVLLEGTACKDNQIASVNGEYRILNEELNKFKVEVEALKKREQQLSCELQEEKKEVDQCEKEVMELFSEVQASVVNATMLDEKVFEWASRCEGLDISTMVLRETLKEEIILKNTNVVELKKKLDDFENENGKLRTNLKVLFPLFFSLGNGISYVEKHLSQLEQLDDGCQENSSSNHQENHETSSVDHDHSTISGVLEMQNLIAKVEALQKLVVGTKSHLDQERLQSAAKLESARREIEELQQMESSIREKNQGKETSSMVKDIGLDLESSSFGASRFQGAESIDQMVKSWEVVADTDDRNRVSTAHGIEAVEEGKSKKPSTEPVTEKYFGPYIKELSREIKESQEEWNRGVTKRLASDAEKLSSLQGSAQELKLKMENYGMSARQNRMQFDTLKAKLKDAEEAIFDLIDRNGKLTKMVDAYSDFYDGEERGLAERSQVLEQARSASDRIGMLELELQKIDYIFLKLQEEWESFPTVGGDRSPRVLLRDYLYGRHDRRGKKGFLCGCMRPRTQE